MNYKHIKHCLAMLGKIIISGLLAFAVLTLVCFFYYNSPSRYDDASGATDHKRKPGAFYSLATEGYARGRINNDGLNNTFDYDDGMEIHTLIIGSSHMEALEVLQEDSAPTKLGKMMGDKKVYNLGMSGHNLLTCISNMENALNKYNPTDYIVIETGSFLLSNKELAKAVEGNYPEIVSSSNIIINILQKNQYLRLLYMQLSNYMSKDTGTKAVNSQTAQTKPQEYTARRQELIDELIRKVSFIASSHGVKAILVYHPELNVLSNGELLFASDADTLNAFNKSCAENGVTFLDMSETFRREYINNHILPYGFPNSTVDKGHLNKYGHAMVAEELYKLISEVN